MIEANELPRVDSARTRLRQAAIDAFAKKGFHGTTTRDISIAAGMSPAALYVHYPTKEHLLYELSFEGHQEVLRIMREATSAQSDPVHALQQLVQSFSVHHASMRTSARIVNHELTALSPEHFIEIMALRREIEQEMRQIIDWGVETGTFHTPDAHLTSAALLSLGIDLTRWYRDGLSWSPEDVATYYAGIALRIVGVEDPA